MPFGSSAKKVAPKTNSDNKVEAKDIFFNTKLGQRIFRIVPGDEIRLRSLFFAKNSDGSWEPTFGYNDKDVRERKPVTIAVFDAENESWVYNGEWGDNPIDHYVESLDISDDDKSKMYAKETFRICVLDRTKVKTLSDGTIVYPDVRGNYPTGTEDIVAQRVNTVKILQGSSGTPKDENGDWKGKHLYRELLETVDVQLDEEGSPRDPTTYDLRLTTSGKGIDTKRSFSVVPGKSEIIDWSEYKTFDLKSWIIPWTFDHIRRLMAGGDYYKLLEEQKITMYPAEIEIEENFF